jgi:hypothetical protein
MARAYRDGRVVVLWNMATMLLAWLAFVVVPVHISSVDLALTGVFVVASALTVLAVSAILRRTLRPLPLGLDEPTARIQSRERFTSAVSGVVILAVGVAYGACAVGFKTGNPTVYAVPFLVGEALMIRYALPRPATVESVRRRLEAEGVRRRTCGVS